MTVTLLDWDDTCVPSSMLRRGLVPTAAEWADVAAAAAQVLEAAKRHGPVFIVTNSERAWVELCLERFVPSLRAHLQGVTVVSARDAHAAEAPDDPLHWKCAAMAAALHASAGVAGDVIGLGDQVVDRVALFRSCRGAACRAKSVQFAPHPTVAHLVGQLRLLALSLPALVAHPAELDLRTFLEPREGQSWAPAGLPGLSGP